MFEISFQGPCADDMIPSGAIDIGKNGYERVYIGKGETRAVAASRALGALAESSYAQHLSAVQVEVDKALQPDGWNLEADGVLCNMFCVIRVS